MRQRNDTGHPQTVMAWPIDDQPQRRPFPVGPGEEIDFPEPITGFTLLDPLPGDSANGAQGEASSGSEPASKAPKATRSKSAAVLAAEGSDAR